MLFDFLPVQSEETHTNAVTIAGGKEITVPKITCPQIKNEGLLVRSFADNVVHEANTELFIGSLRISQRLRHGTGYTVGANDRPRFQRFSAIGQSYSPIFQVFDRFHVENSK